MRLGRENNRPKELRNFLQRKMNGRLILCLSAIWLRIQNSEAKEYCQFEIFNVTCPPSQIIIMEEARYGRLQLGRCVTRDYGFLGCSASVLDLLDRTCSGQRSCQFSIPTLRDLVQPCPKDLTSYLEASYTCVTVLEPTEVRCNGTIILDASGPPVYLHYSFDSESPSTDHPPTSPLPSAPVSPFAPGTSPIDSSVSETALGPTCPLTFVTQRGQKIDVTLYSFGQYRGFDSLVGAESFQHLRPCPVSAHVIENGRHHENALCQARHREQHIYTTNVSRATVYFERNLSKYQKAYGNYILKLQAVGCPDLNPSVNSWIERIDDRIIIRCNFSLETWYLTCKGTSWIGAVTNCSEVLLPVKREIILTKKKSIPVGLVIAVIIGIVFGVVLGLVMLLLVYLFKRRRALIRQKTCKLNSLLDPEEVLLQHKENEDNYARKVYTTSRQRPPPTHIYGHVCPSHSLTCRHRCQAADCGVHEVDKRCYHDGQHVTPPPPPPLAAEVISQQLLDGTGVECDERIGTNRRNKHVQFTFEPETASNMNQTAVQTTNVSPQVVSGCPLTNHSISNNNHAVSNPPGTSLGSSLEVLSRPDLVQGGGDINTIGFLSGNGSRGATDASVFDYKGPILFDWEGGSCAFVAECTNPRWPT